MTVSPARPLFDHDRMYGSICIVASPGGSILVSIDAAEVLTRLQ